MNTARFTFVAPGTMLHRPKLEMNCWSSSQARFCTSSRRIQPVRPPPKLVAPMMRKSDKQGSKAGPGLGFRANGFDGIGTCHPVIQPRLV